MPLLKDIPEAKLYRIFLMGEPGTGKSVFSTSLPGKTKVFDHDGKIASAHNHWLVHNASVLERVDVTSCTPFDTKGGSYLRMQTELEGLIKGYEQTKVLPFDNLVIDSTTIMAEEMLQWMLEFESGIKRPSMTKNRKVAGQQDYGVFAPLFRDFIFKIFSVPWNVVMTGHIGIKQDEKTGELHRVVAIPGRMSKQIGIYFPEVYRTFMEGGKYMAQTKADNYYACRSQIAGIPEKIELKWENIAKKWK